MTTFVKNNLTEIFVIATSLAQTPSTMKCTVEEKATHQSKVAALEEVSRNVDTHILMANNIIAEEEPEYQSAEEEPDEFASATQK